MATPSHQASAVLSISAPPEQQLGVRLIARALHELSANHDPQPTCELVGPHGERHVIPEALFHVLVRVVDVLARGDAVTVAPVSQDLTTQQAANILNVSRQYLVRLLDEGRIPHTKTGKHRRVLMRDLLEFKARRDEQRRATLTDLTHLSEDFAGYPEIE
jgi:excisionase family DNA binding protein